MNVKQREIILIKYPFSNLKDKKARPGLVISNNELNSKSDDCIIAPLTSVLKDEPYSITIKQEDLESGKLIRTSRIRLDKLSNIDKKLIVFKIGVLNELSFDKVKKEFSNLI